MSKQRTNEKAKEIEEMRKKIPELEESAFTNYHWILLKIWLKMIALIGFGLFLGVLVIIFVPFPPVTPLEPYKIEEMARVLLAPSITMNGLFITFVPIISFFFIEEVKEHQKIILELWTEQEKKFQREDDLEVVNRFYGLDHILRHNIRSGVLRYTRTYLIISLFSLFFVLQLYTILSPALFILVDTTLLLVIFTGIFPIISTALYKPALRLVRYVIPEKIVTRIEPEK